MAKRTSTEPPLRRRWVASVAVLACVSALGACGVGTSNDDAAPNASTTTTADLGPSTGGKIGDDPEPGASTPRVTAPRTTERATVTTSSEDAVFDELEAMLVTDVPDGYERQDDEVGDTGPSDFDKAVSDEGGGREVEDNLTREGFVAGYQRLWLNAGDEEIVVFLYQFETSYGATAHYEGTLSSVTSGFDDDSPATSIPGVDTGTAVSITDASSGEVLAGALAAQDTFVVTVQTTDPNGLTVATSVLKDQLSRLP